MSSFFPLKANDEVRAFTCRSVIFDSALINSSLTPSLRYSSFLSALMSTKGRTAMDFVPLWLADGETDDDEQNNKTNDPVRNVEDWQDLRDSLRKCPARHDVSDRDLVNIAPLQLGQEIVHSTPTTYQAELI